MTERGTDAPPGYREFASARVGQLFRIAFLMCGDWHQAEDLVQTTLARLLVSWNRVRRRDSVDAYARRVLLNAFLQRILHTMPQVDRPVPPGSMAEWRAVVESPAWHL